MLSDIVLASRLTALARSPPRDTLDLGAAGAGTCGTGALDFFNLVLAVESFAFVAGSTGGAAGLESDALGPLCAGLAGTALAAGLTMSAIARAMRFTAPSLCLTGGCFLALDAFGAAAFLGADVAALAGAAAFRAAVLAGDFAADFLLAGFTCGFFAAVFFTAGFFAATFATGFLAGLAAALLSLLVAGFATTLAGAFLAGLAGLADLAACFAAGFLAAGLPALAAGFFDDFALTTTFRDSLSLNGA